MLRGIPPARRERRKVKKTATGGLEPRVSDYKATINHVH